MPRSRYIGRHERPIGECRRGRRGGLDFTFDPLTGELKYSAAVKGVPADRVFGAWIQRGAAGEKGPMIHPVLARGDAQASGTIVIPPAEHARLKESGFYLAIYTRGSPLGASRAQLAIR